MSAEDRTRKEQLQEHIESLRQARRRERALFKAPVTPPAGYSRKALRRMCLEAQEEFARRG
jgi:hypothetical protein